MESIHVWNGSKTKARQAYETELLEACLKAGGGPESFQLHINDTDPSESDDLTDEFPEIATKYRSLLENFEATLPGRLAWCEWLATNGDDEDQADGLLAKAAVRLLRERRDQPFFIALGFHKPHDPFHAPRKYFDLYPLDELELPVAPADRSPRVP